MPRDPIFQAPSALTSLPVLFLPIALSLMFPTHDVVALVVRLCLVCFIMLSRCWTSASHHFLIVSLWLMLSSFWSVSPSVSWIGTLQVMAYLLIFLVFRQSPFSDVSLLWGIRLLVVVALLLSVFGVYQALFGYSEYFRQLDQMQDQLSPTTYRLTHGWLVALSGRVFSRFALPSQFAGFLLMILPLHVILVVRERHTVAKIVWGMGLCLNLAIFFYTKSFGAWVSLMCLVTLLLSIMILRRYTLNWRTVLLGGAFVVIGGFGVLYLIGIVRGHHLWDLQGNNPLKFRVLNWKAAIHMFRDHPFLGTGLLTFGKLYPQYMVAGANESQYAHNTYLQLATEFGLIGIGCVIWGGVTWGKAFFKLARRYQLNILPDAETYTPKDTSVEFRFACALGGLGFLLHNIVDFDLYVFPLGALGLALLALSLNSLSLSAVQPAASWFNRLPHAGKRLVYIAATSLLVALAVMDWQATWGKQQHTLTNDYLQQAHYQRASETIQQALRTWPVVPEYQALAGNIELHMRQPEQAILYFETAIQGESVTPWFHAGLAEAYLATENVGLAYLESRRAAELFPLKSVYQQRVQEIQALLQQ